MLSRRHSLEVVDVIVLFVSVFMVYYIALFDGLSVVRFPDIPMVGDPKLFARAGFQYLHVEVPIAPLLWSV